MTQNRNRIDENVVEVQRKHATREGDWSSAYLTEEDGPSYFNTRTGAAVVSLDDATLPIGWNWVGNWKPQIDRPGADSEGFILDDDKPMIRRRWWKRPRERVTSQANLVSSSSSSSATGMNPFLSSLSPDTVLSTGTSTDVPPPRERKAREHDGSATPSTPEEDLRLVMNAVRRLNGVNQKMSEMTSEGAVEPTDEREASRALEEGKRAIEEGRRTLAMIAESSAAIRIAKMKLSGELERDAKRFETIADRIDARLRNKRYSSNGSGTAASQITTRRQHPSAPPAARGQQQQQQQPDPEVAFEEGFRQLQMQQLTVSKVMDQVEYNEIVIRTRNEEIKDVAKMAATVNGMMTDLAKMVDTQGDDIRKIKSQTADSRTVMANGLAEVEKADKYQQDGGSCVMS